MDLRLQDADEIGMVSKVVQQDIAQQVSEMSFKKRVAGGLPGSFRDELGNSEGVL